MRRLTFNMFLITVWMFFYPYACALSFADPTQSDIPSAGEGCTPAGVSSQKLTLSYSQNLDEKDLFAVGWNLYSPVHINKNDKPALGSQIQVARCLPNGRLFIVGQGTVEYLNGTLVYAKIKGFENSMYPYGVPPAAYVMSGNQFWRPMVGDMVLYRSTTIQTVPRISPKYELGVEDLFSKTSDGSYSFDLSDAGRALLAKKFAALKRSSSKFLIEGFRLDYGDRGIARTETLMRAQTVASYLVSAFDLDPRMVVPIGYGSDWLKSGMQPVNDSTTNEGIVLRAFPQ